MSNTVGPIGGKASVDDPTYSLSKLKDNMLIAQSLDANVRDYLKKKFKIKKLSKQQEEGADCLMSIVMANETPDKWLSSIASYGEKPVNSNPERVDKIDAVAAQHGLDSYVASMLFASKG